MSDMDPLYGSSSFGNAGVESNNKDDEIASYSDTLDVLVAANSAGIRPISRPEISAHGSHSYRLGKPSSCFKVFMVGLVNQLDIELFDQQGPNSQTVPNHHGSIVALKRLKEPHQLGIQWDAKITEEESMLNSSSEMEEHVTAKNHWLGGLKAIRLEIQILTHASVRKCENVIRLAGIGWETDPVVPFLCLEYATHGSLDWFISSKLSADERLLLCVQVAQGLLTLHRSGIIHGDVKPKNILICKTSRAHSDSSWVAKLSDFGNSIILGHFPDVTDFSYHGTPAWKAPEAWNGKVPRQCLERSDIFSFGLLVCYIYNSGNWSLEPDRSGNPSNEKWTEYWNSNNLEETLKNIVSYSFDVLDMPPSVLEKGRKTVEMCLKANPLDRYQMDVLLVELGHTKSRTMELPVVHLPRLSRGQFKMSTKFVPWECQQIVFKGLSSLATKPGSHSQSEAMLSLSNCYMYGFGCLPDFSKSLELLRCSAQHDNEIAKVLCEIHHHFEPRHSSSYRCSTCNEEEFEESKSHNLLQWYRKVSFIDFREHVLGTLLGPIGGKIIGNDFDKISSALLSIQDINESHKSGGRTALHIAVILGSEHDVIQMLERGADVNIPDWFQTTPLASAIRLGRTEIAEILLENGADCTACDKFGFSPLHWIFVLPCCDIIPFGQRLIEKGGTQMLHRSAQSVGFGSKHWLFRFWGSPLHCSIIIGSEQGVELLAPQSSNAVAYNWTALELATALHQTKMVDILLENGAHPRSGGTGRPAFHFITDFNSHRIFHRFLLHGFPAKEQAATMINTYILHDQSIDIRGKLDTTALLEALALPPCANYVIEALLECGADPNSGNKLLPALGWSVAATGLLYHNEVLGCSRAELLIKYGANVNELTQIDLETSLHLAARCNLPLVTAVLIHKGADIEVQAAYQANQSVSTTPFTSDLPFDSTPLLVAAQYNAPDVVAALLDRGANIESRTKAGRTAPSIASRNHHRHVAEILINRGAALDEPAHFMSVIMALGFERETFLRNVARKVKIEDFREGFPTEEVRFTLMSSAIYRANPEAVKYVLNLEWPPSCHLHEVFEDDMLIENSPDLAEVLEKSLDHQGGVNTDALKRLEGAIKVLLPKGTYDPLQLVEILYNNPQDLQILRSGGELKQYQHRMSEIRTMLEQNRSWQLPPTNNEPKVESLLPLVERPEPKTRNIRQEAQGLKFRTKRMVFRLFGRTL